MTPTKKTDKPTAPEQAPEKTILEKCEEIALSKYGKEKLQEWTVQYKRISYLPVIDVKGNVLALAVLRPVTRFILDVAAPKREEGEQVYLSTLVNECWIEGDARIREDEDFAIPANQAFNIFAQEYSAVIVKR